MRFIMLALLLPLAACGTDPASLGITGAPVTTPPVSPAESPLGLSGPPQNGTQLSPSMPANTGSGRFWGYN